MPRYGRLGRGVKPPKKFSAGQISNFRCSAVERATALHPHRIEASSDLLSELSEVAEESCAAELRGIQGLHVRPQHDDLTDEQPL